MSKNNHPLPNPSVALRPLKKGVKYLIIKKYFPFGERFRQGQKNIIIC
ncbi:hypothetical protein SAMN04488541_1003119 [Thermoflexibacter ruber]|uniref:Uncharacterized protein n=1 Tax=Thermoflexibacter ruber TaxID=1003 RepID=A0A1I2BT12_9BACT|nr:hypothetical protein SAMN04488541_1003119 [Thermoflexibacter ruber]